MAVQAYVLVNANVGQLAATRSRIEAIDGVKSAALVTGPYDLVVLIEAPDNSTLGRLVVDRIAGIEGVQKTLTCVVV